MRLLKELIQRAVHEAAESCKAWLQLDAGLDVPTKRRVHRLCLELRDDLEKQPVNLENVRRRLVRALGKDADHRTTLGTLVYSLGKNNRSAGPLPLLLRVHWVVHAIFLDFGRVRLFADDLRHAFVLKATKDKLNERRQNLPL